MNETPICKSSENIRPEWVARYRHIARCAGAGMTEELSRAFMTCKAPEWCPRIWGEFREHCSPECAQLFCDNANAKLFDPVPAKPKCEDWCGLTYEDGRVPTDWHGPQTFPFGVTYGRDEQDAFCTQACLDGAKLEKSPSYDPIENRWCTNDDVHWAKCEYIGCAHLRSRTGGSAPGENTAPIPARPWKTPVDAGGADFWGDANMVQHSGVVLLPDKFGTARTKLERDNAQFRPRWR